jgi:CHAD domain-containing protein
MEKKEIISIIRDYFSTLKKQFGVIKKDFSPETIKLFRIGIKKLRAFLRLLGLETNEPEKLELHGSLKKMHKSGGYYRDFHLLRQRVTNMIQEKPAIRYSKNLESIGSARMAAEKKEFLSHGHFVKTEKKIRHRLPEQIDTATLKAFIRSRMDGIYKIIKRCRYTDKEMHSIRKQLKDVLYIIKLYAFLQDKKFGFRFWTKKELEQAKAIEDDLGFLNDTRNQLALLTPADINPYTGEDKKLLLRLKRDLLKERRDRKADLLKVLNKLQLNKPK